MDRTVFSHGDVKVSWLEQPFSNLQRHSIRKVVGDCGGRVDKPECFTLTKKQIASVHSLEPVLPPRFLAVEPDKGRAKVTWHGGSDSIPVVQAVLSRIGFPNPVLGGVVFKQAELFTNIPWEMRDEAVKVIKALFLAEHSPFQFRETEKGRFSGEDGDGSDKVVLLEGVLHVKKWDAEFGKRPRPTVRLKVYWVDARDDDANWHAKIEFIAGRERILYSAEEMAGVKRTLAGLLIVIRRAIGLGQVPLFAREVRGKVRKQEGQPYVYEMDECRGVAHKPWRNDAVLYAAEVARSLGFSGTYPRRILRAGFEMYAGKPLTHQNYSRAVTKHGNIRFQAGGWRLFRMPITDWMQVVRMGKAEGWIALETPDEVAVEELKREKASARKCA